MVEAQGGLYILYFRKMPFFVYAGQTLNYHRRKFEHKMALIRRSHENRNLRYLCERYGIEDFQFFRIDPIATSSSEYLMRREKQLIGNLQNSGFVILNKGYYESSKMLMMKEN